MKVLAFGRMLWRAGTTARGPVDLASVVGSALSNNLTYIISGGSSTITLSKVGARKLRGQDAPSFFFAAAKMAASIVPPADGRRISTRISSELVVSHVFLLGRGSCQGLLCVWCSK